MMDGNDLTGYRPDNALIGYGGQNAGGNNIGYDGKVETLGDFIAANLAGLGMVSSPFTGMIGLGIGAATGFQNGLGFTSNLKGLAQQLGLISASPSVIGAISNDLTSGLGNKNAQVGTSLSGAPVAEYGTAGFDPGGDMGGEFGAGGFDASMEGKNNEGKQGFATGGYTGNASPQAVTGPVHGREFVFSAPAVAAIGLPTLRALMAQGDPHYAAFVRAFGPDDGEKLNMLLSPRR